MIRTLSGTADPLDRHEERDPADSPSTGNSKSRESFESEKDVVERAETQDFQDGLDNHEKGPVKSSHELQRPVSRPNTLSRVASHITTHSLKDPGPPPDRGWKAWSQVMACWLAILTTWGWVNCFGE